MRLKETLLGLAVVAVLAAAAFFVRGRQTTVSEAPARTENPVPDISLTDGAVDLGDVTIHFSVSARPITAFSKNRFLVRAEAKGEPRDLGDGALSFAMTMPMGDHRYTLIPGPEPWKQAEAVLPSCPSGNRRWFGTLTAVVAGKPRVAKFQFDLSPGSPPEEPR